MQRAAIDFYVETALRGNGVFVVTLRDIGWYILIEGTESVKRSIKFGRLSNLECVYLNVTPNVNWKNKNVIAKVFKKHNLCTYYLENGRYLNSG